ncbi:MAG: hypothetical protein ABF296_03000 [Oceanococcaceae bacterium]
MNAIKTAVIVVLLKSGFALVSWISRRMGAEVTDAGADSDWAVV